MSDGPGELINDVEATAPNDVDLWRVHYVTGSSRSSSARVDLIEGRPELERWLLDALLEAEGRGIGKSGHRQERMWSSVLWWTHKQQDDDGTGWGIIDVLAVWRMVDGAWERCEFELQPPAVVIWAIDSETP